MTDLTVYEVIIIGAGPAGLTAAYELQRAGIRRIAVIEADSIVGGISKTVNRRGNRIDIGGHRFFSKSDWVMSWWASILPVSGGDPGEVFLQYRGEVRSGLPSLEDDVRNGDGSDKVMLVRNRLSRIYYNRQFFDYPLKLDLATLRKLGWRKTVSFGVSYCWSRVFPVRPESSLEDFLVNRFGRRLYRQFFKEYTEKVWGVPCDEISADWGAQRIKSLSVTKAMIHAARKVLGLNGAKAEQTSLIESFIYPKHGPGQMWEEVAQRVAESGGEILMEHRVVQVDIDGGKVRTVTAQGPSGDPVRLQCRHLISTMPVKDLVSASAPAWSAEAKDIAQRLQYRDFITVGLLYPRSSMPRELKDNWIYIQEPGVKVGRVQVFNNWSPAMVANADTVWLGLEFFARDTDDIWQMADSELKSLAQRELREIGLVNDERAIDGIVLKVPKAYPGYFGEAYAKFDRLQSELDTVENLFLVGRNGMHRYNNQDHSMLTAKEAVDQIISGKVDKTRIWAINVDDEYHEERANS